MSLLNIVQRLLLYLFIFHGFRSSSMNWRSFYNIIAYYKYKKNYCKSPQKRVVLHVVNTWPSVSPKHPVWWNVERYGWNYGQGLTTLNRCLWENIYFTKKSYLTVERPPLTQNFNPMVPNLVQVFYRILTFPPPL